MTVPRRDREKRKKQVRSANVARQAAVRRLITLHSDQFNKIYAEEAAKVGIIPAVSRRQQRITKLKQQIAELEKK